MQLDTVRRLLGTLFLLGCLFFAQPRPAVAEPTPLPTAEIPTYLSPYWPANIQRWGTLIYKVAYTNGLDPDFVAAVVNAESDGYADGVSEVGAVGLMGVMPTGPGLEWRPAAEELLDPSVNLRWGTSILTDILQQTGGDVAAALAAYNAGWYNMGDPTPQTYTAQVLDEYARAIVLRSGGSPALAGHWTIALEIRRGHVPPEALLVLGESATTDLPTYGSHILFNYIAADGTSYYVRGYAVPLSPTDLPEQATAAPAPETLATTTKIDGRNTRLVIACLPTLSRLRGHLSTRWFAPSTCPTWREGEGE